MSGLVNYSSEEEQDDYQYTKAGERERVRERGRERGGGGGGDGGKKVKHRREHRSSSSSNSSSDSDKAISPPPRKEKIISGGGDSRHHERSKSGNLNTSSTSNYSHRDEDKYKSMKRPEKYNRDPSRDRRDNRDMNKYSRDSRGNRDNRDDCKSHDNGNWQQNNNKKYDDSNKRHSKDHKREDRRDSVPDYYRDDNKRSRFDDKKACYSSSSTSYNKDRSSSSKSSRHDERKPYEDRRDDRREDKRSNDDRRSNNLLHKKAEYTDRNERKDRRGSDDRCTQRSHNQDRSNSYRSNNNKFTSSSDRRAADEDRKHQTAGHHSRSDSPDKSSEQSSSQREQQHPVPCNRPEELKSSPPDVVEKKVLPTARNFEALLSLPLSETAPKHPNVVTVPPITTNVEGDAAALTTVQLPSYYNPKVINPSKYAQQIQKRKLIWGAKKTEDAASKWGHAQFSQDSDGKVASKFMRLMGIKNMPTDANAAEGGEPPKKADTPSSTPANPDYKSREAMFTSMEQQYEVARQVTHTMRGVGLGFSSQTRPY